MTPIKKGSAVSPFPPNATQLFHLDTRRIIFAASASGFRQCIQIGREQDVKVIRGIKIFGWVLFFGCVDRCNLDAAPVSTPRSRATLIIFNNRC